MWPKGVKQPRNKPPVGSSPGCANGQRLVVKQTDRHRADKRERERKIQTEKKRDTFVPLAFIIIIIIIAFKGANPSVTRSATKMQLNLKLGFFSRRLWTWDKRQTKSATVRPQICNYSATYKPLLFFQRDGPRAIAPRVTGLV